MPVLPFLAPSVPRASILRPSTLWFTPRIPHRYLTASSRLCEDRKPPEAQRWRNADFVDNMWGGNKGPSDQQSSSSADLLEGFDKADLYRPEDESRASKQGSIVSKMNLGNDVDGVRRASESLEKGQVHVPRNTATIKSRPSLGRTVEVTAARGVAVALQQLEAECRRNNVRVDQKRQRFHERPGMKRKRLKSERWRKRFKIAFKATVQKVQAMRRKGW